MTEKNLVSERVNNLKLGDVFMVSDFTRKFARKIPPLRWGIRALMNSCQKSKN